MCVVCLYFCECGLIVTITDQSLLINCSVTFSLGLNNPNFSFACVSVCFHGQITHTRAHGDLPCESGQERDSPPPSPALPGSHSGEAIESSPGRSRCLLPLPLPLRLLSDSDAAGAFCTADTQGVSVLSSPAAPASPLTGRAGGGSADVEPATHRC